MGVFWIARSTPKTPRYLIGDASNRVASIFPAVSAETVRQWEQSSGNEAMTLTTAYEYDAYGNITRLTETARRILNPHHQLCERS